MGSQLGIHRNLGLSPRGTVPETILGHLLKNLQSSLGTGVEVELPEVVRAIGIEDALKQGTGDVQPHPVSGQGESGGNLELGVLQFLELVG